MTLPPPVFSRRAFLRLGALGLASGSFHSPLLAGAVAPRDFRFVVINDLHYRDARCDVWFQRVVAEVEAIRPRPAFVMLAGDLAEDGHPEQLAPLRAHFAQLTAPVRIVIGNHDHTEEGDRSAFAKICGPTVNYHFAESGIQFLALDTTQQRAVYRTRIAPSTLQWVRETLPSLSPEQPIVILTHFPLGRNFLRPLNTPALLALFRRHHLVAAYSGHWHGITERQAGEVQLSTGRCCSWWRSNHDGSDEKGYRICRVYPDPDRRGFSIEHQFRPVSVAGLGLVT